MGKGSRNRQLHLQDKEENPKKYNKKVRKPMPKWVTSAICIVILAGVLFGIGAGIFNKYGIIERNRIIVDSKTGEYDVTQQIASYVAWKNVYYEASMYWLYCKYGIYEDTYGITKSESEGGFSQDAYALAIAQTTLETTLRDVVDDTVETLVEWVAVCDKAYEANVQIDDYDRSLIQKSIDSLVTMGKNYGYDDLNAFLAVAMGKGMRESDIQKAEEMSALYNKYCTMQQASFEKAVTLADLETFRNANPEKFYKTDYLSYVADTEAFAKELTAETIANATQFKELVLTKHFNDNYKASFNKFVTQIEVTDIYNSVKNLTDTAEGTALTNKLNELGFEEAKDYTKDTTEDEELKKWLFDTKRKKDEVATFTNKAANGIYIVAFCSDAANETTVKARVKLYDFVDGDALKDDTAFKTNILTYLKEDKKDKPAYPSVTEQGYKKAEEKAKDFIALFEAAADATTTDALLTSYGKKSVSKMDNTTESDKVPETVRDEIISLNPTANKIYRVDDGVKAYAVYVTAADTENEKYDIDYVTFEADTYYLIIDDLTTSLDKVYPKQDSINPSADAKEGSFEEWISERGESATVSARKEFDKKYFANTVKDEKTGTETTTYNVYMVVNTPMYLDSEVTVNGAYVSFNGKDTEGNDAKTQAQNLIAKLQGKTNAEALYILKNEASASNPTISTSITKSSLASSSELQKWFYDDARTPNSIELIETKSSMVYVAIFIEKRPAWESSVKESLVTDQMTKWLEEAKAGYSADESVLDKLGEPTPETTAPETTTAPTT